MSQMLMPEIDFAHAPAPNLHEILDELRRAGPVVPVRYHDQATHLVTRYDEVREAFADEEHFPAEAFHRVHAEPSMGRTMLGMTRGGSRVCRRSDRSRPERAPSESDVLQRSS